jgi:hypothetical protein
MTGNSPNCASAVQSPPESLASASRRTAGTGGRRPLAHGCTLPGQASFRSFSSNHLSWFGMNLSCVLVVRLAFVIAQWKPWIKRRLGRTPGGRRRAARYTELGQNDVPASNRVYGCANTRLQLTSSVLCERVSARQPTLLTPRRSFRRSRPRPSCRNA